VTGEPPANSRVVSAVFRRAPHGFSAHSARRRRQGVP
jgi:hypothetical protein